MPLGRCYSGGNIPLELDIKMAKIVHFGKYYSPDVGGIESVTITLAKGAARAGHFVSVVCFKKNLLQRHTLEDGVHVFRSPVSLQIQSQPLSLSYFILCIKESRNADIVHLHAPNILAGLCSLFLKRDCYLVVHWHSDIIGKALWTSIVRPLELLFLSRASVIITTSKKYADASKSLSLFRKKIKVIPIGVRLPKFFDADSNIPFEIEEALAGKRLILSVGRLVAYKGFDVLIQAVDNLPADSIVLIVGDGPLKAKLQSDIVSAGVMGRVILVGRLSDQALNQLFKRASLFCLTSISRAEAFGVVLLEAMSYGIPIIASDMPGSGMSWVNEHGVSGYNVLPGCPNAIAQACNKILSSTELHRALSLGAKNRFLLEFSEEIFIARVIDEYAYILNPH